MSEQAQNQFAPIFEKDGNQFLVCHRSFAGTDDKEAWEIGVGPSLVECILWGAKFTGKTCEVTDDTRGYEAHLQGALVAIISGPLYDELAEVIPLGPQEPPDGPMIYNRRQTDGTFRSLAGFWERDEAPPADKEA